MKKTDIILVTFIIGMLFGIFGITAVNVTIEEKKPVENDVFIGDIYEGSFMMTISMTIPAELMEINDTLFFITKNDTMYTCGNNHGNLYMRRYKY